MVDTQTVDDADLAGRAAGWVVGLIGGAKAGSILIPIPVVGTFTGAVVGGVLGGGVGRFFAQALTKAGSAIVSGASSVGSKSLRSVSK